MRVCGHDAFIVLDAGWRVLNGQVPAVDFYSAHGPLTSYVSALGLMLSGLEPVGLLRSSALISLCVGLWTLYLSIGRMPPLLAGLSGIVTTLVSIAPFPVGAPYYETSIAMAYNRWGYALLSVILVEACLSFRVDTRKSLTGAISSGTAISLLCFLKITFAMVGLALFAGTLILYGGRTRRVISALSGFLLVAGALVVFLHVDLAAFLRDVNLARQARSTTFSGGHIFMVGAKHIVDFIVLLSYGTAVAAFAKENPVPLAPRVRLFLLLFPAAAFACGVALASANAQRDGIPILGVTLLILLAHAQKIDGSPGLAETFGRRSATLVFATFALATLSVKSEAMGVLYAFQHGFWPSSRYVSYHLDAPGSQSLVFFDHSSGLYDEAYANGQLYTESLNDGLSLLRENTSSSEKVIALAFSNPFAYLLRRKPVKGGSLYFHVGNNIAETAVPSAEALVGDAAIVMVPHHPTAAPSEEFVQARCQPLLQSKFQYVASSAWWTLYRRI